MAHLTGGEVIDLLGALRGGADRQRRSALLERLQLDPTKPAAAPGLLSSHILAEVEALCDHVTIIRSGRAAETGTFDELRHLTRTSVVVETARPADTLRRLPGVHDVRIDRTCARFGVDAGELNRVLAQLVEFEVRSLISSPPTPEELFMPHYGEVIASHGGEPELVGAR